MTAAPPPPAWTVTSVLEQSYLMARDNFAAFVTITLIFGAISLVVDVLSLGLLSGIVHLACGAATTICITWGSFQVIGGRKPAWEAMLRQVQAPAFGRLLVLGIVVYFVIGLSAILIVPPLFLLPLWAVAIPAMMVERVDFGAAFSRSADLTRYRRVPILLIFLLLAAIIAAGATVIFFMLGHGALARLVVWVYGAVAATVMQPLPAILYVLLREEKEGVAPAQIASAAG
jgi:hypothetical protein